jgi:hypothetical protein
MLHLLVDFLDPGKPVDAEALRVLFSAHPGVLSVCVSVSARQAEVVIDGAPATVPEELQAFLRTAGHLSRVTPVPGPEDDSDYARYFYSDPDTVEARWRD